MKKFISTILSVLMAFSVFTGLGISASALEISPEISSEDYADENTTDTGVSEETESSETLASEVATDVSESTDAIESEEDTDATDSSSEVTEPSEATKPSITEATTPSEYTDPSETQDNKTVITLEKASEKLYVSDTVTIKVTVKNGKGDTTFTSSSLSVATVSSDGKVTAKREGTAKIVISNNNVKIIFKVTVKNPSLSKSKVVLNPGETYTLKIKGQVGEAKFINSNKKYISVSSKGVVKAKNPGSTIINVKTNGMTLKCRVTVNAPKLNKKYVGVYKGKTVKLTVSNTNKKAVWSTSDKKIAKVSTSGKVTAKKAGTATITAKVGSKKLKCKIFVYNKTKTVKNKIKLKKYIQKNGEKNANGDKVISSYYEYDGATFVYGVSYTEKSDKLTFMSVMYLKDATVALTMPVTVGDKDTVKITDAMYSENGMVAYEVYKSVNVKGFKLKNTLTFKKQNSVNISNSDIQKLANDTLKIAFYDWNTLLKSMQKQNLKKIGFENWNK